MTEHETEWQLGDMPDFDPIEMKRRIQAEIYEETKGMTGKEVLDFFRKGSEEFWAGVDHRRAERATSEPQTA